MNTKPEDCIVIEDAVAGIKAANFANMISVGIGNKNVLADANYVLENTKELTIDFLKKLN